MTDMNKVGTESVEEKNEEGASLVEYVVLVALIVVICIAGIQFFGQRASQHFSVVSSVIGSPM